MPFTFSHPAIVLSLVNRRHGIFSATGLIAGSIAPDFETIIKFGEPKIYSHTWAGMFWFDLPLGLCLIFIFHMLVRNQLILHLPAPLKERFAYAIGFDWLGYFRKNYFKVILSLLIGIFSHLLWDAFTHLNLRDPDSMASAIKLGNHRLYIILQYVSSVIGLAVVGVYIYQMPRTSFVPAHKTVYLFWWLTLVFSVAAAVCGYIMVRNDLAMDMVDAINLIIASVLYAVCFATLSFLVAHWRRRTGLQR